MAQTVVEITQDDGLVDFEEEVISKGGAHEPGDRRFCGQDVRVERGDEEKALTSAHPCETLPLNRLSRTGRDFYFDFRASARMKRPPSVRSRATLRKGAFTIMSDSDQTMRECPSYPGYFADGNGNVYSDRSRHGRARIHQLKSASNVEGYLICSLMVNGIQKTVPVHTIVLDAFVGPRPPRMECRHKDGTRKNNRLDNLCWGTKTENQRDRIVHGTDSRGARCGNAKLTWEQVRQIRHKYKWYVPGFTQKDLAKKFGVGKATICRIVHNKRWIDPQV